MTRKSFYLLTLCWLAYSTVPVINNIGVFNGVYVMLCITKGVMIHHATPQVPDSAHLHHSDPHAHHKMIAHAGHQMSPHANHHAHHMGLEDADSQTQSAEDHEAEGCPCIHYSFDTTLFFVTEIGFIKALESIVDTFHVSPMSTIYAAQARGPPTASRVYSPFIMLKFTPFT